ncbi:winged helix-turn-helix transcriptional regulator [Kordiimonas aquimaris]|uniref:winged helix-turn-helix transcriptional regulator n=1 Tax=Kordiimonas aquimaris TaxID=707591 RepID=UPI0021D3ACCD|nr:helix-turn-helix domain-containing protein [Kordiimonas aquimaris]
MAENLNPVLQAENMVKTCSIWRALEVIGDAPILLILESIWMGSARFGKIQETTGLLKALLSDRLKKLTHKDILTKRNVPGLAKTTEYALTPKGAGLFSTVLMLYWWERKWGIAPARKDLLVRHENCGSILEPQTVCGSCNKAFELTDVDWKPGPGVGWMSPSYSRRRNQTKVQTDQPSLLRGSVEIMGDRWSALVMRAVFTGIRRFDQIQKDTGAVPNTLSSRLKALTDSGVLKAETYQHAPIRNEYFLTQKGYDYYYIIMMLMIWGDQHFAAPEGPPVLLRHKSCGGDLNPYVSCHSCTKAVTPGGVSIITE